MRLKGLFLLILLLPAQAWCVHVYDAENIKTKLENTASFKISAWRKSSDDKHAWEAVTSLKYSSITVTDKKAELILPFINARQKKSAKKRCTEFAGLTLASTKKELAMIKKAVKQSTTRHQIKYVPFKNATFYVVPKLVHMRVSLHCAVKS